MAGGYFDMVDLVGVLKLLKSQMLKEGGHINQSQQPPLLHSLVK